MLISLLQKDCTYVMCAPGKISLKNAYVSSLNHKGGCSESLTVHLAIYPHIPWRRYLSKCIYLQEYIRNALRYILGACEIYNV